VTVRRLAAGLLLLLLVAGVARAAPSETLNIGFIGSFGGAGGNLSQDQLDGFKLGVKHLGGRLGGIEFELTVMDDRHDADAARRAAERLLREERTQILLLSSQEPSISSTVVAAAAAGHAFLLGLGSPAPQLAGRDCNPYFFSLAGLGATLHDMAGQYFQSQNYHSIAVAGPDNPATRAAAELLGHSFKGMVTLVTSKRGEMNFHGELERLRALHPDAVYLLQSGGMAVNFVIQWDRQKLKPDMPLYGPATSFDQNTLAAAGEPSLNLFSFGPWSEDLDNPANKRLLTDFESEYGRPASYFAAVGYDAAMLLDAAFRQINGKFNDDEALRGALRNVDFPTTRGSFRFDSNQFPIQAYLLRTVVEVVKDVRGHYANEQRAVITPAGHEGRGGECPMRWTPVPPPPAVPPKG
jgi:branched-chain amino acid transport system substrate-binding protein